MKTINLNFLPTNRLGEPHVIDYSAAQFLQEQLDKRINKERPALEAAIADQLQEGNTFQVSTEQPSEGISDFEYLRNIVSCLDIDNLLKGKILARFDT